MTRYYKLMQSESGDWFMVDEDHTNRFYDDELNERITNYAHPIELHQLRIIDWE